MWISKKRWEALQSRVHQLEYAHFEKLPYPHRPASYLQLEQSVQLDGVPLVHIVRLLLERLRLNVVGKPAKVVLALKGGPEIGDND